MTEAVAVATVDQIPEEGALTVDFDGEAVAIFNVQGAFYAVASTCAHAGGPIAEGDVKGDSVTCPWHGWEYEVASGCCRTAPGAELTCYSVRVDGPDILLARCC